MSSRAFPPGVVGRWVRWVPMIVPMGPMGPMGPPMGPINYDRWVPKIVSLWTGLRLHPSFVIAYERYQL